jgi:hypothetical protein
VVIDTSSQALISQRSSDRVPAFDLARGAAHATAGLRRQDIGPDTDGRPGKCMAPATSPFRLMIWSFAVIRTIRHADCA